MCSNKIHQQVKVFPREQQKLKSYNVNKYWVQEISTADNQLNIFNNV